MPLRINYGSDVIVLPGEAAEGARDDDLYVLTMICRLAGRADDRDTLIKAIAAKSGRDENEIAKSVDHWEKKKVFFFSGESDLFTDDEIKTASSDKTRLEVPERHPQYTGKEAAKIIDSTAGMRELIDECQNATGKIFNASEVTALISLSDYLRLTNEYIVTLFHWCCSTGHKSLRYIEKTAYNLFDEGITSVEALSSHIERLEAEHDAVRHITAILNLGDREPTKKESSLFSRWLSDWEMSPDVIQKAYEITLDGTKDHKLSYEYMNKVLENWHSSGAKTPEDVQRLLDRYKKDRNGQQDSKSGSSFDTDEFFELALKRSFERLDKSDSGKPGKTKVSQDECRTQGIRSSPGDGRDSTGPH